MRRALPATWFGMIAKRTICSRERKRCKKHVGSPSKASARSAQSARLIGAWQGAQVAPGRDRWRTRAHVDALIDYLHCFRDADVRRADDFPESAGYGSPISASRADLSRCAIPRRRSFCAMSASDEWPVLRGEPQIETAIWRRSTWIDECPAALLRRQRQIYTLHSRWPWTGWVIRRINVPYEGIPASMHHRKYRV